MCGRYYVDESTQKSIQDLSGDASIVLKKGDVNPSQRAAVLTCRGHVLKAEELVWGFSGYRGKQLLINARAETIRTRQAFKENILTRRCVIPCRGFYEWSPQREKFQFEQEEGTLYLAGCFDENERFVIITTAANTSVLPVHDRMPLLISEEEIQAWITDRDFMISILQRVPEELSRQSADPQMNLFDL